MHVKYIRCECSAYPQNDDKRVIGKFVRAVAIIIRHLCADECPISNKGF